MTNLKVKPFDIKYIKYLNKIYTTSFSKEKRFSFIMLLFNTIRKKSEIFMLLENETLVSFLYAINYKNSSFILYLAVESNKRNKGYGSYLLNWYCRKKINNNIYLNIDEVDDCFSNNSIRKKRLQFYLSNKFYDTTYISVEKDGNFNILSSNKNFNLEEYIELDKKISIWFLSKKSIIVKK